MNPSYDWDYSWLNGNYEKKVTPSSSSLHYFNTEQKEGYRRINCLLNDKGQVHQMKMFLKTHDIFQKKTFAKHDQQQKPINFSLMVEEQKQKKQIQFSTQLINQSTWVEKYTPRRYIDLLSDESHNRLVLSWVKKWDKSVFTSKDSSQALINSSKFKFGQPNRGQQYHNEKQQNSNGREQLDEQRLILLSGPPGCGKTTLARIVAKHCGYKYLQINASDNRAAKQIVKKIDNMASMQSISQKPTFIIIDEVDGILQNQSNGIKEILTYIETGQIPGEKSKKSNNKTKGKLHIKRPLIFICNDPFVKGLKQLRKKCYTVYMHKIRTQNVIDRLKNICQLQDISVEREALNKISTLNQNDIRGSMAMLEFITKTKQFSQMSATKVIQSIHWDIKNTSKSPVDFIETLMHNQHIKKNLTYKQLNKRINDIQNSPSLILETLFTNLKNSKTVERQSRKMPDLFERIAQADIIINKSFGHESSMSNFNTIPYFYFKLNFKADDNMTRVQFPIGFFEGLSKKKDHKKKIYNLWSGLNPSLKPFYSRSSLNSYGMKPLFMCIQTTKNVENQLIRCLKIMITYGLKFGPYDSQLFQPPLQSMLTIGKRRPTAILSLTSKALMKNNYNSVKQSIENHTSQFKKQSWKVASALKKKKGWEGIQYKFCEGTGTQIKYVLKMNYFL